MAINKNFVIKNGIEVNDNVFVVDPNENIVGINTALPDHTFHVIGGIGVTDARITGVTTALGDVLVADSTGEDGKAFAVRVSAGNSVGINTANPRYPLEIIGPASSGTIAEYVFGDLEVTGDISVSAANFSGVTKFTDTTQNTLGNVDTGSVQLDGGLGVAKNVTIGAGLSVGGQLRVTGDSFFVGVVTFAAGASGTIQLGDNANDNVEFQADVNSNIIPNATSTFNLGSDSQEWRDLHLAGNAGIGSLSITGISTFSDNVEITSLTDNRIPIVGAGSTIEDDSNLTFDGITLAVGVDLDVTGNTGIGSLVISGISTFSDNVEITSLTDNRIAIVGAGSTIEDDANLTFDGSRLSVGVALTVSGISTFSGNIDADGDLDVDGRTELDITNISDTLNVVGIATFANNIDADGDLDVDGHTELDDLNVAGVSTFVGNIDADGNLDVDGHTELDDLNVAGVSTFVGVSSFTNTTENTLGDANTGSVQFDGGLGIAGNVTVGGGLSITGNSYFVGMVTFAAGTDGNITLGDSNTDNVVFVADVNSNIVPNTDNAYDLGSSSQQWKNLYVNGLAELDFVNVSAASTFVGDVSIADKIVHTGDTNTAIRFPAADTFTVETAGEERLRVNSAGLVGIGTDDPGTKLDVQGGNWTNGDIVVGQLGNAGKISFRRGADGSAAAYLGYDGATNNNQVALAANSADGTILFKTNSTERLRITYDGSVGIGSTIPTGKLDVVGHTELDDLNVAGVSTFVGVSSFTNTTNNTLGDVDSGSVKFDGGLGIAGNVTVGGGLSVTGNSYFVGMVTFAAGTNGNITLGDNAGDNVIFNADVNSNITPNINNAYDLGSSSQQWRNFFATGNAGIGSLSVAGISTFVGLSTFNDGLIVHAGISTFEERIVGAATSNVIPFYYANVSDFPSATTYHGAFAHAHDTGKAYFAHANAWLELVNANTSSVVGTGTEGYNVGVVTATQVDIGTGGLDVDGHTELDGVNVSGATTTNILHVGTAGTVLSVNDETSTFAIGSASNNVTATMNGGAIPSIGLVIALGG